MDNDGSNTINKNKKINGGVDVLDKPESDFSVKEEVGNVSGSDDVSEISDYIKRQKTFRYKSYLFFKRTFDIIFSAFILLAFCWLIGLLLLIKWLEDFSNPVYVSKRVGKNGKVFKFYKIRTMCPKAEEMKEELIKKGLNEADPPAFKMKNDPRITKFGKFLRKTSLDEILQFINVLNGSLSIIGPRSPLPEEVTNYTSYQKQRLLVKGGLLCYWQISRKRHDITFEEWVELDIKYIKKQSFWLDVKLLFKGIFFILFNHDGE